ncbi:MULTISPECIES: toprim domain-containing protein [unclassified Pseudomonas]|nr:MULTISPECIES: toprim domain-containing protein [unclassified Pseudomonas]
MTTAFGQLEFLPVADGAIHRFLVPGDRAGSHNGWYLLFADGIASGCFGSWKVGAVHHWSSREPVDHLEAQLIRQRIAQAKHQREAGQRHRQQSAAEYAQRLRRDARRADPDHGYLIAKQIRPFHLRQHGNLLLVPLIYEGVLVNLQRIGPDGKKRFLSGGRITGCYSPLGSISPGKPLYVSEGWATGATIHESTGSAVACAMTCGNLLAVGQHLQRRYPDAVLIVAGDDDRQTDGNPGKTAAIKAAAALGCGLVLPPWPDDAPLTLSDFNDLANWRAAQ